MKQILLILLATFSFNSISAETIEIDGIYYTLSQSDLTAEVTENPNKYKGDITIPGVINVGEKSYKVVSIGFQAFKDSKDLTSIIISENIRIINSAAFYDCLNLNAVIFPESINSIESVAFSGCSELKELKFPHNLTFIGNNAFSYCDKLTTIDLPENELYTIAGYEFNFCKGLTTINIPSNVTQITGFNGCTSLTSISIPKQITEFGEFAFAGCSNLSSIVVEEDNPVYDSRDNCNAVIETASNTIIIGCKNTIFSPSITGIGNSAFYGRSNLVSLDIPNTINSIGKDAFQECTGLKDLYLPESIISIGKNAFNGCSGLTTIMIPSSLKDITSVFTNCTNLSSINIPDGVEIINDAFTGCSNLSSVSFTNSVKDLTYAFFACTNLTSMSIPDGITTIGGWAFSYSGLSSVILPQSIHSIEYESFANCLDLKDFYVYAEDVPTLDSSSFRDTDIGKATLHVPSVSLELYKNALIWKDFGSIVAISKSDPTGIYSVFDNELWPINFYSVYGIKRNEMKKGLNIIRMSDGTTKKVIIK